MRVEPGDREPRLRDPEVALEPAKRRPAARFDQRAGELRGHVAKRQMGGDRDRPQRRPGQHHHDIARRDPAALGDELGLAGMLEADRVELLLRHGAGDHCRSRARAREPDRDFERIERAMARRRRWDGRACRPGRR